MMARDNGRWRMAIAKDQIKDILESQPDDSTYDELLRELAFKRMIEKGLADADANKVISNEEMRQRMNVWQQ
jgi:predicted transcriptional regulator